MQAQVDIEFDQLVKLAKQLPPTQWTKLKREVEEKVAVPRAKFGFGFITVICPNI